MNELGVSVDFSYNVKPLSQLKYKHKEASVRIFTNGLTNAPNTITYTQINHDGRH